MVFLSHAAIWTEANWGLAMARGEDGEENGGALDLGQEPAAHNSSERGHVKPEQACCYGRWL